MEHQAGSSSVDVVLLHDPVDVVLLQDLVGVVLLHDLGVDEGLIVLPIHGEDEGLISSFAFSVLTIVEGSMNIIVDVGLASILLLLVEEEASESGTSALETSVFAKGVTAAAVVKKSLLSV